jgi:hypothetical protein
MGNQPLWQVRRQLPTSIFRKTIRHDEAQLDLGGLAVTDGVAQVQDAQVCADAQFLALGAQVDISLTMPLSEVCFDHPSIEISSDLSSVLLLYVVAILFCVTSCRNSWRFAGALSSSPRSHYQGRR